MITKILFAHSCKRDVVETLKVLKKNINQITLFRPFY